MSPAARFLVSCRGVDVRLGPRLVLENVDFDVDPGRIYVLVGPNGGGKTTLLRLLLGLVRPSRGEVLWHHEGTAPGTTPFPIGYVPQRCDADLGYPLTVRDVVALVTTRHGPHARRRTSEELDRLGLSGLADRPIAELSGGQQQRLWIARALAVGSPLLLLDEPTTALDASAQEELRALLLTLRERDHVSIVCTTHYPGDAAALADRAFRIERAVVETPPSRLADGSNGSGAHA